MTTYYGIWCYTATPSGIDIRPGWLKHRNGLLIFYPDKYIAEAHAAEKQLDFDRMFENVDPGKLWRNVYEARPFAEWEVLMSLQHAITT